MTSSSLGCLWLNLTECSWFEILFWKPGSFQWFCDIRLSCKYTELSTIQWQTEISQRAHLYVAVFSGIFRWCIAQRHICRHYFTKVQQELPPPLQTNNIVGPPTMKAEIMFRFKLFFCKHKVLYSVCILLYTQSSVCSLHFIPTSLQWLQSAFYTDRLAGYLGTNFSRS